MDKPFTQFPDMAELSIAERDALPVSRLRETISAHKLASFPLQVCQNHDVEGLTAVAEKIAAVSAEWPSCGIALCMHYNVLIAVHRMPIFATAEDMLKNVGENESLIASAFSEFLPERGIFSPALSYRQIDDRQIELNGDKKPCTLSSLANYMVVSCGRGEEEPLRLALIPRSEQMAVDYSFYTSTIFGASDTHRIIFDKVKFSSQVLDQVEGDINAMVLLNYGMSLFNILIGASYSGIIATLFEEIRKFAEKDENIIYQYTRFSALSDVLVKNMIRITAEGISDELVSEILVLRYQLEREILDFTQLLWERLPSQCIIGNPNVSHLISTCRMIKYHPLTEKRFIEQISQG